ncbi:hypothetical protein [uncultured Microscilla sp.]|uniref:hypothetical protein n=1 Tax=uncultured Microscilla sp. TaxID=432653 RepID=UPI0026186598|nr:hypothetical protein [uncultured Microscilla sp.]
MKQLSYILIICLLWACGETSTQSNNTSDTSATTTVNKNDNDTPPAKAENNLLDHEKFLLKYPKNWKKSNKTNKAGELANLVIEATSAQDRFRETLGIFIRRADTQPFTLKSFANIIKEQLKKEQPTAKIVEEEMKPTYFEVEYVGDYKDQQMKWRQRAWVNGKEAFVAIYTAGHDDFKAHEPEVNLMMNSFKIK